MQISIWTWTVFGRKRQNKQMLNRFECFRHRFSPTLYVSLKVVRWLFYILQNFLNYERCAISTFLHLSLTNSKVQSGGRLSGRVHIMVTQSYTGFHFQGSQHTKPSLRVKITIILSSNQSNFHLHYDFLVNPGSTYTYYRPLLLFHQSKFTETKVILNV